MTEVIDTLEVALQIKPDKASMAAATAQLKKLEKASDETADAARDLSHKQRDVKAAMAKTAQQARDLAVQEKKLTAEIAREGVATRTQSQALESLRANMTATRTATAAYKATLHDLSREQDAAARKSVALGRAARSTRAGLSDARGSMQEKAGRRAEIVGSAKEVGAAGLRAGAAVGGAAIGGTIALGTAVLTTSANFEKLRAQLKNLEGSEAGGARAFKQIQDFAKNTPYELEEVTNGFVKLRAMGLDASKESMTAYGDLAATMGKDMNQIVEAVADASTGEFERLKEFGIKSKTVGDNVQFTFKGITTTVKKNAESIEGYIKSVGKMEGVGGAMAGQMSTAMGMISNLKDAFSQFMDAIGQAGVLDEFKGLLTDIAGVAGGEQDGLAKILAGGLVDAIKALREIVKDLTAEDIKGWFNAAKDAMMNVADGIRLVWDLFSGIIDISGGVDKAFANMALGVVALKTAFMGPAGLVVAAAAAGMAIGNLLNAFGASDALANFLGDVTGLNEELDRLGARNPKGKRGAPGFAVSGDNEAVDANGNLVKQDLVQYAGAGGKEMQIERDTLIGIADGSVKSDSLSREGANNVLTQIYSADMADLGKKAAAKGSVVAAKVERAKPKGKGKSAKDTSLEAEIDKQLQDTARELSRRDTARALQQGKISKGEMRAYEKESYDARLERSRERFARTGELPAGIASDLAQIRRLPNEEDLVGRTQAPVISITNKITNIRDNRFELSVEGTFTGTPEALATAALGSFRRQIEQELGGAYPDYVGPERL